MDQRAILEIILGVYRLDKKYRSNIINRPKPSKERRLKYETFAPNDYTSNYTATN